MLDEAKNVMRSTKGNELEGLGEKIRKCRKCRLWTGTTQAVPGEGTSDAKVIFIGQNPGAEEDRIGRPFMGPAGKFLDEFLQKNGIDRGSVFMTNVVKHKTPGNRIPFKDEISACKGYLIEELDLIKPKLVVLMGMLAWKEVPRLENTQYTSTCHPAAAMRFPKMRAKFESDLGFLKRIME